MRSFLISIAVFLCVTVSVFCSSAYVRRTCGEILAAAQRAQFTDEDSELSSLVTQWEKERVRFRAIVGHTEVDPADEALADMESWVSSGGSADSDEFEAAKVRFLTAVEGIRACEVFSFDSIF